MTGLLPFAFPLFFAGMWIAIAALLSRLSGWSELAKRYPAAAEPEGERVVWTSAQIGGVSFRSCLNATLAPSGLYLVPARLFRLFMPPVLVPWSDIHFEGFTKVLFFELACFRLGGAEGPIFCVFTALGARMRVHLIEEHGQAYDSDRPFEGTLIDSRIWLVAAGAAGFGLAAAYFAAKR
jgi:hypothetical protein